MISAVTAVLKLDKSAVWRRVQTAIKKGYLVNNEASRGRPARLVPGYRYPTMTFCCLIRRLIAGTY